jgi:hypothetical protein
MKRSVSSYRGRAPFNGRLVICSLLTRIFNLSINLLRLNQFVASRPVSTAAHILSVPHA